jgi:hypothetical protein
MQTTYEGEQAHRNIRSPPCQHECMNIDVTCACGYQWESHSASGRTRCRSCGRRVYIPLQARRNAGLDTRPSQSEATRTRHNAGRSTALPPSPQRAPRRVQRLDEEPSRRAPEPHSTASLELPAWVTDAMSKIAASTPQPWAAPARVPTPRGPTTPTTTREAPRTKPQTTSHGFFVLVVACGCQLLSASPAQQIRCPIHGRVATRRSRPALDGVRHASLPWGSPIE